MCWHLLPCLCLDVILQISKFIIRTHEKLEKTEQLWNATRAPSETYDVGRRTYGGLPAVTS